jgi:hypothetical protein
LIACRYRVDIFLQRTASAIASEILANTARNEEHRALEEALERIQVLQSRCTENEEMLRQKDTAHNALIQKMAETSRTQAPCHVPSSLRLNAFDDFNSDLKLQAEAGRALAVALRQQIGDEQERAAALQKQLVREREQVRPSCFALATLYVYIYVFD